MTQPTQEEGSSSGGSTKKDTCDDGVTKDGDKKPAARGGSTKKETCDDGVMKDGQHSNDTGDKDLGTIWGMLSKGHTNSVLENTVLRLLKKGDNVTAHVYKDNPDEGRQCTINKVDHCRGRVHVLYIDGRSDPLHAILDLSKTRLSLQPSLAQRFTKSLVQELDFSYSIFHGPGNLDGRMFQTILRTLFDLIDGVMF